MAKLGVIDEEDFFVDVDNNGDEHFSNEYYSLSQFDLDQKRCSLKQTFPPE